jgi:hypothetical protein
LRDQFTPSEQRVVNAIDRVVWAALMLFVVIVIAVIAVVKLVDYLKPQN